MLFSVWEEYVDFVNKKILYDECLWYLVLLICNYFVKIFFVKKSIKINKLIDIFIFIVGI